TSLEQLDAISGDRIFLFQLSDFGSELTDPMETARHHRVFPGEGSHGAAIVGLIERAAAAGYGGDYTFEVFNDDYLRAPAPVVMERARKSVEWLGARISLAAPGARSEEHTSELQSRGHLVCRLLLEKKKKDGITPPRSTSRLSVRCIPYATARELVPL